MPANMKFSLRFIRHNAAFGSGKTDDVVTIKPTEGGQFTLDYLYRNAGQRLRSKHERTGRDLFRWMRTTLGLLELDSEPFATLQLDVTGFPSILFEVSTLFANRSRAYHAILDTLEFFLDVAGIAGEVPADLSETKFAGFLLRRNAQEPDDFFKIGATENGEFVLAYTFREVGADDQTNEMLLSRSNTSRWLGTLLELLDVDNDPFDSFQLSVTGFPDTLLTVADVEEDRIHHRIGYAVSRIIDTLEYFLDTVERPAPAEPDFIPVPREVPAVVEETVSDEEEKEDDDLSTEAYSTDSEDEYADMPPLLPADQCCGNHGYNLRPRHHHLFFDEDGDVIMGH